MFLFSMLEKMGSMWHSHTEIETIDKLKVQLTHKYIPTTARQQHRKIICNCAFRFQFLASTVFRSNNTREQPHSSNLIVLCEFCGESREKNEKTNTKIEEEELSCLHLIHLRLRCFCFFFIQQSLLYRIVLIKALRNSQSTMNLCLLVSSHLAS